MLVQNQCCRQRRGATTVETAFVILPMVIFLFGVFEYGRFLMVMNVFNNAAREGTRYALANNGSATISTDVTAVVTTRMGSQKSAFTTFTVSVSGTHLGVATPVNDLAAGDLITVTVTGTYKFMNIIPVLPLPTTVILKSAPTMVCEGAT